MIDEKRWERQLEGIEKWRRSKDLYFAPYNGCGIIKWVTGMGKTFATAYVIQKYLEKAPDNVVLILVTRVNLIGQWEKTLASKEIKGTIYVSTIQSYFTKLNHVDFNFLIIDEIHEFYSAKRKNIILNAIAQHKTFLGLSATPEDYQKRHEIVFDNCPIVDVITEKEAIENKWISDYYEYNLGVYLTVVEKKEYDEYTAIMKEYFSNYGDFSIALKCMIGHEFDSPIAFCSKIAHSKGWKTTLDLTVPENVIINNNYSPSAILKKSKELMEVREKREKLCYVASNKYKAVLAAFNKFNTRKTIIFSQAIEFADKIAEMINTNTSNLNLFEKVIEETCVVYHSKLRAKKLISSKTNKLVKFGSKRLKERALERISTGESRAIAAAEALDTGTDIPSLSLALNTSTTRSKTRFIQRAGRAKRTGQEENKVIIINIYCLDTVEESILGEAQTTKPVWIRDINQINDEGKFNNTLAF